MVNDMTNANELAVHLEQLVGQRQAQVDLLTQTEAELVRASEELRSFRVKIHQQLASTLRVVSGLESRMETTNNTIAALKEGLAVQDALIAQIEFVKRLPDAYQAGLTEAGRRLSFGKTYRARIQRTADSLARERDEEIVKREVFNREFGRALKFDLIPGLLTGGIPPLEITQRPFDEELVVLSDSVNTLSSEAPLSASSQPQEDGPILIPKPVPTSDADLDDATRLAQALTKVDELSAKVAELELVLRDKNAE